METFYLYNKFMKLIKENKNLDIEETLLNFMEDITKCKDELSCIEKEYESLLNNQDEGTKKIKSFSDFIGQQNSL